MENQTLTVFSSAGGLGDGICGVYAACGLANAGCNVRYHCRYTRWLTRIRHPGVELIQHDDWPRGHGADMNWKYQFQIMFGEDRKQWYCDRVADVYGLPAIKPAPPQCIDRALQPGLDFGRYVLLSPYSAEKARMWPLTNWRRLTELLIQNGLNVLVTLPKQNRKSGRALFQFKATKVPFDPARVRVQVNLEPSAMVDAILGAACVVGNDSGIPHVSGLFGVPTVAVHSHLPPGLLWSHTQIRAVTSETGCTGCRWLYGQGFTSSCEMQCSALASISPEKVLAAIGDALNPGYTA